MAYETDSKEKILFRGETYCLRIRSRDARNPVVLFLHGGCGSPDRAQVMKQQSPLAEDFTLVAFDQRGAGFAYDKSEAKTLDLTKEIYVEDAHNVIDYLKERFRKDKIIIVGHSFGSALGVWVALKHPEDILAYVGVGQCVDYAENEETSYQWTLAEAKRVGDKKAVTVLETIGAPKEGKYAGEHQKNLMKQRAILHRLGGATFANRKPYWQELLFHEAPIILREYGLRGFLKYVKGLSYSPNTTLAVTNPNFLATAKEMQMPVYLLLGRHDYNCCCSLAEKWLTRLVAPKKKLIWFERSAHSPQWEEPERWNEAFKTLFPAEGAVKP